MTKQSGFAIFQVLLIIGVIAGIIYARIIVQNHEASKAKSQRIATQLFPVISAYMDYAASIPDGDTPSVSFNSEEFYSKYYAVSSDPDGPNYELDLQKIGYDTTIDGISVTSKVVVT